MTHKDQDLRLHRGVLVEHECLWLAQSNGEVAGGTGSLALDTFRLSPNEMAVHLYVAASGQHQPRSGLRSRVLSGRRTPARSQMSLSSGLRNDHIVQF